MLIRSVFDPLVQSVPKIASGPTKKKMVAPMNSTKKTKIPMEKRASRQVPLLSFLLEDLMDPARPATPSSRKTMEEM